MPTTPNWEAAVNGRPGNLNATNHAAQLNQFLGSHAAQPVYSGSALITPVGGLGGSLFTPGNSIDMAQPFVMPVGKTNIGRITLPCQASGNGADMVISLVPQSGGSPDMTNILARTVVPASWFLSMTSSTGLQNGGPLCTAASNNMYGNNNLPSKAWGSTAVDASGSVLTNFAMVTSGNYMVTAGGSTSGAVAAVTTIQFTGQDTLSTPQLQPALPQASSLGALAATSGSLVYSGGNLGTGSYTSNVYTANWDNLTGTVGAWSAQASLPQALEYLCSVGYNNTVYVVGGIDVGNNIQKTVYYATVSNGQITTWNRGPDLPVAVYAPLTTVINGWLIVAGGSTNTGSTTVSSTVVYAKINADGSLGNWRTGPSLPTPMRVGASGWNAYTMDSAVCFAGGGTTGFVGSNIFMTIDVDQYGMGPTWKSVTGASSFFPAGAFSLGNGVWNGFNLFYGSSTYSSTIYKPESLLSVPLWANGLTPGNTYYILFQQHQYSSSSDYLALIQSNGALPSNWVFRGRNNLAGSWTTGTTTIPISVFDQTPGGQPLHIWEDPETTGSTYNANFASRTSTLVYGSHNNLIGIAENTVLPNDPFNANPTFTSGVSSWTPHNCTFTQSSAQTHGGFPFSGLMTPNGVAAAPNVTSELIPVHQALVSFGPVVWVMLNGWFYSPTGWATVSLSADWYDVSQTYISTSSSSNSLAAATWKNLVSLFQPPANAFYVSVNFVESGTPGATNTVYFSNVTAAYSPEQTQSFAPVAQIDYTGVDTFPPSGVTQLY